MVRCSDYNDGAGSNYAPTTQPAPFLTGGSSSSPGEGYCEMVNLAAGIDTVVNVPVVDGVTPKAMSITYLETCSYVSKSVITVPFTAGDVPSRNIDYLNITGTSQVHFYSGQGGQVKLCFYMKKPTGLGGDVSVYCDPKEPDVTPIDTKQVSNDFTGGGTLNIAALLGESGNGSAGVWQVDVDVMELDGIHTEIDLVRNGTVSMIIGDSNSWQGQVSSGGTLEHADDFTMDYLANDVVRVSWTEIV